MRKHHNRDDAAGTKKCPGCGEWKCFEEFGYLKTTGRRHAYCVPCRSVKNAQSNPKYSRRARDTRKANLRHKAKRLGVTYDLLAQADDPTKACEICGRLRRLHIDHDHKTGKFRGFLCQGCNTTLGKMDDSPALLRAAAEYLERSQK